jgi:hypothetical protein
MTEIPKNFDEYPKLLEFSTHRDDIGIWEHPDGYTIEVTDGYRDAYYKITATEVQLLNELFGFKKDLDFIKAVKRVLRTKSGKYFHQALYENIKPEYTWISGF